MGDTRRLSAAARSSSSRLMRTRRTRTEWPSLPASCSRRLRPTRSRLRRLRRLLPSTWPSSERLSRSLRRLRIEPRWLRLDSLLDLSKYDLCSGQIQLMMTFASHTWTFDIANYYYLTFVLFH